MEQKCRSLEVELTEREIVERIEENIRKIGGEIYLLQNGCRVHYITSSGITYYLIEAEITLQPTSGYTVVGIVSKEEKIGYNYYKIFTLFLGLKGSMITILWPFFPELLPLLPLGISLTLLGWLGVSKHGYLQPENLFKQ